MTDSLADLLALWRGFQDLNALVLTAAFGFGVVRLIVRLVKGAF